MAGFGKRVAGKSPWGDASEQLGVETPALTVLDFEVGVAFVPRTAIARHKT
jgi:hypothetical protein